MDWTFSAVFGNNELVSDLLEFYGYLLFLSCFNSDSYMFYLVPYILGNGTSVWTVRPMWHVFGKRVVAPSIPGLYSYFNEGGFIFTPINAGTLGISFVTLSKNFQQN